MKSENSLIAGLMRLPPDLSLGNLITLKSPPIHQGKTQQPQQASQFIPQPASIQIPIGAINPYEGPLITIHNILELASYQIDSHFPLQTRHNPLIPHQKNAPRSSTRRYIAIVNIGAAPQAVNDLPGN
jgi:hypothetical protein